MRRIWALILLTILAASCWAHDLSLAAVRVVIEAESVAVSVQMPTASLKSENMNSDIRSRLKLELDGSPFSPGPAQLSFDDEHGIVIWEAEQKGTADEVRLLSSLIPGRPTYLAVYRSGDLVRDEMVDGEETASVVGRFIKEGVLHIFLGPDHVLFLLALLFLGGSFKKLLKIVTAFTAAHSITLSLAATGIFTLPSQFVEPVIALSIIAVAIENLRPRPKEGEKARDLRVLMAFGFGLIHGFGFAGALTEVGLPQQALGWALASFNVGVEVGQAAIVLAAAPLLALLAKKKEAVYAKVVVFGSMGVALMGAYWLFERIFAG